MVLNTRSSEGCRTDTRRPDLRGAVPAQASGGSRQGHDREGGTTVKFSSARLTEQVAAVLTAWGLPPDLVGTTAEVMVEADLAGIDSHGMSMLPTYETLLRRGGLDVTARPTVAQQGPVTALIDAGGGFGHPAAVMAMELALDKAGCMGVGLVCVRRSHHFGATGYYASLAAQRCMVGLVTTSARTVCVSPTRGAQPRLPTNPLAFAAPAGRNRPFLLDMSTSTVAINKVKVYDYHGRPLPDGWVLDGSGAPIRDAQLAMRCIRAGERGGLAPLGGTAEMASHKGYGLGLMVQILSATLAGAGLAASPAASGESDGPADIGHFFLAIDPQSFRDKGAFEADLDEAIDLMHATLPIDPELPVLVPGDPEAASREERRRDGVPVPTALLRQLRGVCERAGAPYLLHD
ncbi:MAG: Ldh family oxidoreductase [Pseudonocardiaceae bacterium]|nr:Ldh family oxidoreductase [Pseudonocardiaceae bacterium]